MVKIARKPGKIKKDEAILRIADSSSRDPFSRDILIGFKLSLLSRTMLLFGNTVYAEFISEPDGTIKEKE